MGFQTIQYLTSTAAVENGEEKMGKLMGFLKQFDLTRMEKLQIVNLLPRSEVEYFAIVEECEDRFSEDQIAQVLDFVNDIYPMAEE